MNPASPDAPLLTMEQVKAWIAERDEAAARLAAATGALNVADRRLDALALLFPAIRPLVDRAREESPIHQIGAAPAPPARKGFRRSIDGSAPLTQVSVELLERENGGRSVAWLRERIGQMPEQRTKIGNGATSLHTSLARLVGREMLVLREGLYYHPSVWRRIEAGELVEERVENGRPPTSFAREMERVFEEMGGTGNAAAVVAAAKADPATAQLVTTGASNVYRWLTKRYTLGLLLKEGDVYRLRSLPSAATHNLFHEQGEGSDVRLNGTG